MTTCLIVDDSSTVRKAIKFIMSRFPFDIEEAENGLEALEQCKASTPDLIMLDWNMPVMSGIDFLKRLRRLENGNKSFVIFCTTENDMARIQEALAEGANEYIMKPFTEDIIKEKLELAGFV